jgi:hypothetical protein
MSRRSHPHKERLVSNGEGYGLRRAEVKLDRRGVRYSSALANRTIDVTLDDVRVWSCTLTPGESLATWPHALRELLRGSARGAITDSVTQEVLWQGTVSWRGAGAPDLFDDAGRALRVDKWGRMKPSFETGVDIRPLVARSAHTVLALLQEHGFNAFIVGGTLLGAVRDHEILPHDDDADVAYLSEYSHPADLILENHRLHKLLIEKGFRIVRHSWSHLQVLSDHADADYYVDIFTAFYKSGRFHEPIHVRAEGMEDAILPLDERELHGVRLAAPRDADAWLVACYGPSWRTPDPAFVFETPWSTQRRFHSWFGSFYMGVNNWKRRITVGGSTHETDLIRKHVMLGAEAVVDLGSGDGEDLAAYRSAGVKVLGSDVLDTVQSVRQGETRVNLVDYLPAFDFVRRALAKSEGSVVVAANHLLACQDPRGRRTLMGLIHFAVRRGARVITADYEELGRYRPDQPRTWHLDWPTRIAEASQASLDTRLLERTRVMDVDGVRRSVAVVEYLLHGEEHP